MTFATDLSDFLIPRISDYTPDFGTMLDRGLRTREVSENIAYPLLAQRGFTVTESSDTTDVKRDSVFIIEQSGIELTLGQGIEGIKVSIYNNSSGSVRICTGYDSIGSKITQTLDGGKSLQFRWINEWIALDEITDVSFEEVTEKVDENGNPSIDGENEVTYQKVTFTFADGRQESINVYNGDGIKSFEAVTESEDIGAKNVYRLTTTSGKTYDMTVYNGKGIKSIEQTEKSDEMGGRNTWVITLDDDSQVELSVLNGTGILTAEVENSSEPLGENILRMTLSTGEELELKSINGNGITVMEKTAESTEPLGQNTVHFETADGQTVDLTAINGNGVVSVEQTESDESGGKNTLTVKWADGTENVLTARNGTDTIGIESLTQIASSDESNGKNTWQITSTTGQTFEFTVFNGGYGRMSVWTEEPSSPEIGDIWLV